MGRKTIHKMDIIKVTPSKTNNRGQMFPVFPIHGLQSIINRFILSLHPSDSGRHEKLRGRFGKGYTEGDDE